MADLSFMSGRWIWCGGYPFNAQQWDILCSQVASWEVQGIHPKVADGIHRWYDDAGLQTLKSVAEKHGLKVAPYHYVYGPAFGPDQITAEAQLSAHIGHIFGVVIPDIEDQYMSQYDAASNFAKQVRAFYTGLWIPTMYANPVTHPSPMLSLNPYMDAWLPQVYFSVWNGNAQSAIEYVFPQWHAIDQEARKAGQSGGLKPTLPIISTSNSVTANQIVDFIEKMQRYGYIGFWYDRTYASYASAVISTPIPTLEKHPMSNIDQLQSSGWKYDTQQKQWTAPNGFVVRLGFAEAVTHSWDPYDYPLENEQHLDQLELSNPALGSGARQRFRLTTLEWTPTRGVFRAWTGQELIELEKRLQAASQPTPTTLSNTVQTTITNAVQQLQQVETELQNTLKGNE